MRWRQQVTRARTRGGAGATKKTSDGSEFGAGTLASVFLCAGRRTPAPPTHTTHLRVCYILSPYSTHARHTKCSAPPCAARRQAARRSLRAPPPARAWRRPPSRWGRKVSVVFVCVCVCVCACVGGGIGGAGGSEDARARHSSAFPHPTIPHPHPLSERVQPFDEGAAQVARLLARDRRELLGEGESVADFVAASEFAETAAPTGAAAAAAAAAAGEPAPPPRPARTIAPFSTAAPTSPFGGGGAASPFGPAVGGRDAPGGGLFEEAAPIDDERAASGAPWWAAFSSAQVAVALSFVAVIASMLALAWFVNSVGAIHFND